MSKPPDFITAPPDTDDFELVSDVLLPCLLFAMLGALVWFLLDMLASRFEAPLKLLRLIVFFFMLAVVGIARLRHRNSELSAGAYGLALTAVMALFAYLFSYGGGAFGGGYGGRHPLALMLMIDALVVAIWFGAHCLVEQTAIDPDDESLQTAGMLSSDEWATQGSSAAIQKRPHPGRAVMYLSVVALGVFGSGHRVLAGHASQGHAFWCMVVYLGSAMLVLALSSLTGLELYLRGRGVRMPASVVALWLLLAVPLAAGFLAIAHAAPKLEPRDDSFLPKLPAWLQRFAPPARDASFEAPWLGDSPPVDAPDAHAAGGHDDRGESGREPGQQTGPRTQPGEQPGEQPSPAGQSRGRGSDGAGPSAGQGEAPADGGEGDGGDAAGSGESDADSQSQESADSGEQGPQQDQSQQDPSEPQPEEAQQQGEDPAAEPEQDEAQQAAQPDQPQPGTEPEQPQTPQSEPVVDAGLAAKLLGLLIALALLAALLWKSGALLRGRMAAWQARRRAAMAARPVRTRDPFVDPFAPRSPFLQRPAADTVVHVYRALLAYCELLGKPRRPEHTAHEFLFELPAAVESWRPMIVTLTELYEAVEYTPDLVGDEVRDELRPIWERLMQAVREVRR